MQNEPKRMKAERKLYFQRKQPFNRFESVTTDLNPWARGGGWPGSTAGQACGPGRFAARTGSGAGSPRFECSPCLQHGQIRAHARFTARPDSPAPYGSDYWALRLPRAHGVRTAHLVQWLSWVLYFATHERNKESKNPSLFLAHVCLPIRMFICKFVIFCKYLYFPIYF